MYQFTHMMRDLQSGVRKTYRWRGFAIGLLGGWLPAWGLTRSLHWGAWAFLGLWALCVPMGYFFGKQIKK